MVRVIPEEWKNQDIELVYVSDWVVQELAAGRDRVVGKLLDYDELGLLVELQELETFVPWAAVAAIHPYRKGGGKG